MTIATASAAVLIIAYIFQSGGGGSTRTCEGIAGGLTVLHPPLILLMSSQLAPDFALKAAETDGTKRALATFGTPFGPALYKGGKTAFAPKASGSGPKLVDPGHRVSLAPDDTTPIPRPSRYYDRRQDLVTRDRAHLRKLAVQASAETSLIPSTPDLLLPGRIDKSVLTIAEPRRHRDKDHLSLSLRSHVSSAHVNHQILIICGSRNQGPSD